MLAHIDSSTVIIAALLLGVGCGSPDADPAPTDSALVDNIPAAPAEPVVATLGADTMAASVKLRCEDGGTWGATYWNGPGARVVLSSDTISYSLEQQVAASGIRYADEAGTLEWWAKGDTATFTRRGSATTCVIDPTVAL